MNYRLHHEFIVDASGRPLPTHGMQAAARYYFAGERDEAERCCVELIGQDPRHFDALHLLGVIHLDRAQLPDAVGYLTRAWREREADGEVNFHLGSAMLGLKLYQQAEEHLRSAVAARPADPGALNNLGNVLSGQGRHEEALACFLHVLELAPDHTAARYNMGRALAALDRLDEAIDAFRSALAQAGSDVDPDRLADIHSALGQALAALGRYEEALVTCQAIAGVRPDAAAWNESLVLLLLGRYADGWRKYEARWRVPDHDDPRPDACVLDLRQVAGKRVLLTSEQGRGDVIQFARYAPLLAKYGADVSLQVYVELKPLLQTLDGVTVIADGEPEPVYDFVTPLLSLPLAFGTELGTVPNGVPYLGVSGDRLAEWRQHLGERKLPRIGIAWSGALEHERDAQRSIVLQRLAPLLSVPGCEFHSVQKDIRVADRDWLDAHGGLRVHGDSLRDFADAAALISLMDLVISIDTAAAHVAGALARPVWVMLPCAVDWRWLIDRTDSPWYPTARLFRQKRPGDWEAVVAEVAAAVARQFKRPRARARK